MLRQFATQTCGGVAVTLATVSVAHCPRPTSGLPRTICRRCTPGEQCQYLGPGAGVIQTVSILHWVYFAATARTDAFQNV